MEIGDIKKVRNSAGIFTMKLIEIINDDISVFSSEKSVRLIGNTYGSLGEFKKLRIEFYKEEWISIYDQNNPKYIYFTEIPQGDKFKPKTYKFEILEDEVPEADFIRLEAE